ncbi:MAG: ABC transporter permease [Rhodothermales bacterium]|nr:ABC transporter permease [Rhodothermales bacterium]
MHKIWIILKSEFWRRVRSKWFILTTLLAPFLIIGIVVVPGAITAVALEGGERNVAVLDETGRLLPGLQAAAGDALRLEATEADPDSLRAAVRAGRYDGFLHLPAAVLEGDGTVLFYSAEGGGLAMEAQLSGFVNEAVAEARLDARQVPPEVRSILEATVPVRLVKLTETGEEAGGSLVYFGVGYVMGLFIYMTVFLYGALVMQAVIEEKNSRVVEIVVSSARPFELLMGKVLGVGAMGLVQVAVWAALLLGGLTMLGGIVAAFLDPSAFNLPADVPEEALLQAADITIPRIPAAVFVWFVLFFLGGYLLYASLFAAVGSAVENQQEAQGLLLPIVFLVLVPLFLMPVVLEGPNTPLSVGLSLVPFFSPILMVVRVAVAAVPWWQVVASYLLLIGGFVGSVWFSSRIYRVGILMYGKKPSLRELARWFRQA